MVAPVFLQSDLARTAIYSVKNCLKNLSQDKVVEVLLQLTPSSTTKTFIKAAVFKELVRLLGEYSHVPVILGTLESIWNREKLNPSVRNVVLQTAISLLEHKNENVCTAAWKIINNCIESDKFLENIPVLAMVTKATKEGEIVVNANSLMSTRCYCLSDYQYGDLSTSVKLFYCYLFIAFYI